ncbi:hypothetical protein ACP70R_018551 [Stipagrostis hirtigluma subsp. patula]
MEAGKRAAVAEFCRAAGQKREEVRGKIHTRWPSPPAAATTSATRSW